MNDERTPVYMYFGGCLIQIGYADANDRVEICPSPQTIDEVLEIMERQFS